MISLYVTGGLAEKEGGGAFQMECVSALSLRININSSAIYLFVYLFYLFIFTDLLHMLLRSGFGGGRFKREIEDKDVAIRIGNEDPDFEVV